jgi:hypothetical protein
MASPAPKAWELGRELMWQARQGRQAFDEVERIRKSREKIDKRYDDAGRKFRAY